MYYPHNYPGHLLDSQRLLWCEHGFLDPTARNQYHVITANQYAHILGYLAQEVTEHRHLMGTGLHGVPEETAKLATKEHILQKVRASLFTCVIEDGRHWCTVCVQRMVTLKKNISELKEILTNEKVVNMNAANVEEDSNRRFFRYLEYFF
jgi:hypothetical protein